MEGLGPGQCLPSSTGDHCRQIPVASDTVKAWPLLMPMCQSRTPLPPQH